MPAQDHFTAPSHRPDTPDPAAERPEPAHPPAAPKVIEPTSPEPAPVAEQPAAPVEPAPAATAPAAPGGLTLIDVRRLWPDIVDATKLRRRVAWMHLTQNCQVVAVDAQSLTLGFANAGARDSFVNGGCDDVLRQAAIDVVGADSKIETIVDPGAKADGPVVTKAAVPTTPEPTAEPSAAPADPPAWASDEPDDDPGPPAAPEAVGDAQPEAPVRRTTDPESIAAARGAIQQTRTGDQARTDDQPDWAGADADAHPDDLDADQQGISTAELLKRELGAQMIEEIRHQ